MPHTYCEERKEVRCHLYTINSLIHSFNKILLITPGLGLRAMDTKMVRHHCALKGSVHGLVREINSYTYNSQQGSRRVHIRITRITQGGSCLPQFQNARQGEGVCAFYLKTTASSSLLLVGGSHM